MVEFCEVVFFEDPKRYHWASIELRHAKTIHDAVEVMDWNVPSNLEVGIHSVKKSKDTRLKHLDRVEVYQPLQCSPNDIRKRRQKKKQD